MATLRQRFGIQERMRGHVSYCPPCGANMPTQAWEHGLAQKRVTNLANALTRIIHGSLFFVRAACMSNSVDHKD